MSGYRYHVKVFLATGILEHFYPETQAPSLTLNDFVLRDDEEGFIGWIFKRGENSEFFDRSMVKAVSIGPFTGYVVNVDGHEVYSQSPKNEDVIEALLNEKEKLGKSLQAIKDYLSCKQS